MAEIGGAAEKNKMSIHDRENIEEDEVNNKGNEEKTQKVAEIIVATAFLLFSAWFGYIAYTTRYQQNLRRVGISAMGFPKVLLTLLFILSLIQIVKTAVWFRKNGNRVKGEKVLFFEGKIPIMALSIILYAVIWRIVGFSLSTFLEFTFVSKYLEPERKTIKVVITGAMFTVAIVAIFAVLFRIPFYDPWIQPILNAIRLKLFG